MASSPISVVIPTKNSERTLAWCLESVARQTLPVLETIVVDSCSTDHTAEIAQRFGRVISLECNIPYARLVGAKAALGDRILNLDSDQALVPSALQRAVDSGYRVIAFGESSVGTGIIARMNNLDRSLVQKDWRRQLDPVTGSIRPRLYPKDLQIRSIEGIPENLLKGRQTPYSEDSLIYANSKVPPESVGFVPNAMLHRELEDFWEFVQKWSGYGRAARPYRGGELESFAYRRARRFGGVAQTVAGLPSLLLRAVPFFVGYYL